MKSIFRFLMYPFALIAALFVIAGAFSIVPVVNARKSAVPARKVKTARRHGAEAAVDLRNRRLWFMPMIPENWVELQEPGLRAIFHQQVQSIVATSKIASLFNIQTSSRAFEETFSVGGVGDFEEFNGTIQYDMMKALWKVTYRHKTYVKGWQIEEDTISDDLYNEITRAPREYGLALARTREKHAADTLNNAFSASFLGFDGKALCATDHPLTPDSSTTHGNKGSTAFSHDAVVATRRLMRKFVDARGQLVMVMPDTLVVGPDLEDTAQIITDSLSKPGTGNNDANTQRAKWNVVVWDYLDDSNNWFMVDGSMARMHNWWWNREEENLQLDPQSAFNRVVRGNIKARWSTGFDDWRWLYGHEVA